MTLPHAMAQLARTVTLLEDEPMKRHTSFRVGGPARFLALPETRDGVALCLDAAREAGLPVTILGGGSNFLVPDQGIQGLVLGLKKYKSGPRRIQTQTSPAGRIGTGAGNRLASVCRFTADQGLSGLEFAAGIPGTIGGAVAMNAGSAQTWIGSLIHSLDAMDTETGRIQTLAGKNLAFSYRNLELDNQIILDLQMDLIEKDPAHVRGSYQDALARKKASQPVSQASAGCFFKNPSPEMPAGKLIQEAGLKGKTINDAMVSPVHANFIVNNGNARCQDILALADKVKEAVKVKFNIELENEVKVFGHV